MGTLLIEENIDITLPTHEDIVELHGILSDIKSHELDVAMFDLYGVALHNLPILAVIIILTLQDVLTFGGETEWNLDILPLICFLFTLLVICWKFMKLIVVQCGCNDSSDVPSKFASFNSYRPNSLQQNAETHDEERALALKVTKILNLEEEGDTPDDDKDDEGGDKEEEVVADENMVQLKTCMLNVESFD